MKTRIRVNLLVYTPLLLGTLIVFFIIARQQQQIIIAPIQYLIGGLLICFNIFVLAYHWFENAHPKYSMNKRRVIILLIHLIGGSLELICSLVGILLHSPGFAVAAALSALLLHLPAAVYMIPEVSGAKGIMVPAYIFVVLLNGFFAVSVLMDPSRMPWLVCLFFSLNIYVLCRVFYVVFRFVGLFPYARYTAAILFSCFMLLPIILGTAGNIVLVLFILINLIAFQKLLHRSPQQINDMYLEHQRTELNSGVIPVILDKNRVHQMIHQHPDYSPNTSFTDMQLARFFFDLADTDQNGYLSSAEWLVITQDWKVESTLKDELFSLIAREEGIDFMSFYHKVWLMGSHFNKPFPITSQMSCKDQAYFVFQQIDIYNQGIIGELEIKLLLTEWGLCADEIKKFLQTIPDGLNFEQFYASCPAIWKYYLS